MNEITKNPHAPEFFDRKSATSFDNQRAKLAPIKDALQLCMQMVLHELPADAHVLCVGAGTGTELIGLADAYPQWKFTVVEPAREMMKLCRQRADQKGIAPRCTFHEGYLESLSDCGLFDAATSILVSHFIVNEKERTKYFSNIAKLVRAGGYMISADLCADTLTPDYQSLLNVWITMHDYAEMPTNVDSFGRNVAILPAEKIESIIVAGGFENPILFYQALFITAWYSRVDRTQARQFGGSG